MEKSDFKTIYSTYASNLSAAIRSTSPQVSFPSFLNLNWTNKFAAASANYITSLFGKPPNALNENPGGIAMWNSPVLSTQIGSFLFSSIRVVDSDIPELLPYPHFGTTTVSIFLSLEDNHISNVMKVSQSLKYDKQMKILSARSKSLQMSLAILFVATRISRGDVSHDIGISEIQVVCEKLEQESEKSGIAQWHLYVMDYIFS
jgi:hypothetical protein